MNRLHKNINQKAPISFYEEFKATNFLKNYIYSFIYIKKSPHNQTISLHPDGADYFLFDGKQLQFIEKKRKEPQSHFELKAEVEYFIVRWKPYSLYFFKQEIEKYTQTFTLLEQILHKTNSFTQRKKLIELFIMELWCEALVENKIIDAVEMIFHHKGDISITNLSKITQIPIRTLQRDFKKITSLTPKEFSTIMKLQNSISTISRKTNQHKIVKTDPFYDYSHFYKNFKKYLNITPKEFHIGSFKSFQSLFDL